MKKILHKLKSTSAGTTYHDMLTADKKWLLDQAERLAQVGNGCNSINAVEGERLYKTNPNLPRQGNGKMNSPTTMCEGIVDNIRKGTQRDLTDKQLKGLEEAFRVGSEVINDFEAVTFEEVSTLPKLPSNPLPVDTSGSTFNDLFEITVTVRRK